MQTKEEIREKHLQRNGLSVNQGRIGNLIQKATYDAMDEYAKQVALKYAVWVLTLPPQRFTYTTPAHPIPSIKSYTQEEMFNQFMEEENNPNDLKNVL